MNCASRLIPIPLLSLLGGAFIAQAQVQAQAQAQVQTPQLVRDINPATTRQPRWVQPPVVAGTKAYFTAWTRETGHEIWVTDRTAAGTRVLKDIFPGMSGSNPTSLMAAGSRIFFLADDGTHGIEPWISDGTAAGTRMVGHSFPGMLYGNLRLLGTSASRVWFSYPTSTGNSIWSSDGTPEGTIELNAPEEGSGRRFQLPSEITAIGETAYFSVNDRPSELWRSDGTVAGTHPIHSFVGPSQDHVDVLEITTWGSHLYLITRTNRRSSLWKSDGTEGGTVQIPRDTHSDSWAMLENLKVAAEDKFFFIGLPEEGAEKTWRYGDGTLDGSVRFLGDGPPMGSLDGTVFNGILYFTREDPQAGYELWRSDGSLARTYRLADLDPGIRNSLPGGFTPSGPWLYFSADTRKSGREIWRTDGTEKGTRLVHETARGNGTTLPHKFTPDHDGNLYFLGGIQSPGDDLWFLDGKKRKARQLTTPGSNGVSGVTGGAGTVRGSYLFTADDGKKGNTLWISNGTKNGTKTLIKPNSRSPLHDVGNFTAFGSQTLFTASGNNRAAQVWITNGTTGGTRPLTNFTDSRSNANIVTNGVIACFTSWDSVYNRLWTTSGTPATTLQLRQPNGDPFNVYPGTLHLDGNTLYFISISPTYRHELWRTDGTLAGTVRLKDGFPGYRFTNLAQAGDRIFFAVQGNSPAQFWSTDGTPAGTAPFPVDVPPNTFFEVKTTIPFGSGFLFIAGESENGNRWWYSDGTTAGTRRISPSFIDSGADQPGDISRAMLGGKLIFAVGDIPHGRELWSTDGTPEGTALIADINPGPASSNPTHFTLAGDRVYFVADDLTNGRELWVTDGTAEGTRLAAETLRGPTSSSPGGLQVAGNRLLFSSESLHQGVELHSINLPVASPARILAMATSSLSTGEAATLPAEDSELLNHAFNLPAGTTATTPLLPGTGTSGYPSFTRPGGVFRVEYLRRTDGLLRYTAKYSTTLQPGSFLPMTGTETITGIDALWERVVIEQAIDPDTPRLFGILEVTPR
ncbi:hypothetical protein OKA04_08125 [Luteolibacter flavescens]|uniref:ELWxxDGT repeat-containing protein n=1 Tax=Luteolibacter flavescens TaxID=1859460 RepID=A0ABT3FMA5_9BACT|nr:hypothetical protein [Luteolibacter flavescens]MCW1884693.1 hypothetical protein [Luteolibacter flavescens]